MKSIEFNFHDSASLENMFMLYADQNKLSDYSFNRMERWTWTSSRKWPSE
jgi:hypothetical protein